MFHTSSSNPHLACHLKEESPRATSANLLFFIFLASCGSCVDIQCLLRVKGIVWLLLLLLLLLLWLPFCVCLLCVVLSILLLLLLSVLLLLQLSLFFWPRLGGWFFVCTSEVLVSFKTYTYTPGDIHISYAVKLKTGPMFAFLKLVKNWPKLLLFCFVFCFENLVLPAERRLF